MTKYDELYKSEGYYWGKKPSTICDKIIAIMKPSSNVHPTLLDLGCGEGRNAVYFAKHGFNVTGLDCSKVGLEKAKRYANEAGVEISVIHDDIKTYRIDKTYDVIFSTGTLHYLLPDVKGLRFLDYKNQTSLEGINAFSVFVKKPFIEKAPDAEKDVFHFKSGELMSYYWDWEILFTKEEIFDCKSGGVPHKHAVNRIIARKYRIEQKELKS